MKTVFRLLKRTGQFIGILLMTVILTGLALRLFHVAPQPPGDLVDIGNFKLHIVRTGEKSTRPTLVIEGGGGSPTEFYHWLSEGLKDSMRVIRYDRAGIAHSESDDTPRDPETIARELHALLEAAGEAPPYIMAGHSLGGPFVQVFTELYPGEVVALALLDATHPRRVEVFNIPAAETLTFRSLIGLYKVQAVLAELGVLKLYDLMAGPVLGREMEGLPDSINQGTADYLFSGKYLRTMGREQAQYHAVLERVGTDKDFGDIPVLVFPSAPHPITEDAYRHHLKNRGVDLRQRQVEKGKMQRDYLNLSTNSKLIPIDGNHNTIYTKKENAAIICAEILKVWSAL